MSSLSLGTETGSGGIKIGGSADIVFTHGGQVASDIVVEWDLDNDGDFDEPEEDITSYVMALETVTGRDWPSLLTGKAAPGKLRATLNNHGDEFSYFNTSSPLATTPFSLKTGRKVRIRIASASSTDPVLLAKDRFGRADGALGSPEVGGAWSGPLANDFAIASRKAKPSTEGAEHIAVLDVATTDYYAQARFSEVGSSTNIVGLVYRYQDSNDYSLAVVDVALAQLKLVDVVAGTPTTIKSESIETYDDITLGVLVSSNAVTFYHEGVPVMVDTAIQTDETEVGVYTSWGTGDIRPEVADFYVWDGITAEIEGILWTGDIADLTNTVEAGPEKYAMIEGEGWLSRLATQELQPIVSVSGKKTGIFVGNLLGRSNLLHPPGPIDEGDITTGAVGFDKTGAVDAARNFEEVEFGFLYETNEGPLGFDSRTARDASIAESTWGDSVAQPYRYMSIAPLDWRREIFNRVTAGVSPLIPGGVTRSTYTQSIIAESVPDGTVYTPFAVTMPATVNAGDLLLVAMAVTADNIASDQVDDAFSTPPGWVDLTRKTSSSGPNEDEFDGTRLFAKVAVGNEDSTAPVFFTTSSSGVGANTRRGGVAHVYRITSWFGSTEGGIEVSDYVEGSDPPAVFPSWDLEPSLFITVRSGVRGSGTLDVSPSAPPRGYTDSTTTTITPQTQHTALQSAYRFGATPVENPSAFGGDFEPFVTTAGYVDTVTIAVRGFNGTPPSNEGITVQVDDLDSQDDHNSIRPYVEPANIFATEADAEDYAELVLARHADDRPIVALSFMATKSGAYRGQAYRRRVGDRISLVATGNAGLGIAQDFYIENISHRFSDGVTLWETTWELSPV